MNSTPSDVQNLEFLWLWLNDDDGSGIAEAVDLGIQRNAMVETVFPPIVAYWFGVPPGVQYASGSSVSLAKELRGRFDISGKVIYGKALARVGNIGSKSRFHYGVVALSQPQLLTKLFEIPLGSYEECRSTPV